MHTKQLFIEDMPPWDGRKILSSTRETAEILSSTVPCFLPRKLFPTLKIFATFFFLEAILVGWQHLHSQKLTAKTPEKTMRKEDEIPSLADLPAKTGGTRVPLGNQRHLSGQDHLLAKKNIG